MSAPLHPSAKNRRLLAIARLLLLLATLISAYLTWAALQGNRIAGCGQESDCDLVLSSRWASVFGLPVGLLGAIVYLTYLALGFARPGKLTAHAKTAIGLLILASAAWFIFLQAWIIKGFCPWCTTAHALAVLAVFLSWPAMGLSLKGKSGVLRAAVPLLLVGSTALIQTNSSPPENFQLTDSTGLIQTGADGKLYLYQGKVELDAARLPQFGPPDAPTVFMLSDYTCPHCLELQQNLRAYVEHGGNLRVLLIPAYAEDQAREIHRQLLLFWRADREFYNLLVKQLISGQLPANQQTLARFIGEHYQGNIHLDLIAYGPWVNEAIVQGKQLLDLNTAASGHSTLPQIIAGKKILVGSANPETIRELAAHTNGFPEIDLEGLPIEVPEGSVTPAKIGLRYDRERINLGKILEGEQVITRYEFTNESDQPITITGIQTTCGCAKVEGWEQTVPPGQKGGFDIRFNSTGISGKSSKAIIVQTDRSKANHRLMLDAEVWSPVLVFPKRIGFGIVPGEPVEPETVNLILSDGEKIDPASPTSDNPLFSATLTPSENDPKRYQLTVTFTGTDQTPLGEHQGEITLPLGHALLEKTTLPVTARITEAIQTSPQVLSRDFVEKEKNPSIRIQCLGQHRRQFQILSAKYEGSTEIETQINNSTISLHLPDDFNFEAEANAGGKILIETNHPKHALISMPLEKNAE